MVTDSASTSVVEETTATSTTSAGENTTTSTCQVENVFMDDKESVAQIHGGILQQATHLSSTSARRRANLTLIGAEAATVAITLTVEATTKPGAPPTPVLKSPALQTLS